MISRIFIFDLEYAYLGILVLVIASFSLVLCLLEPAKCCTIPDFLNLHFAANVGLYCLLLCLSQTNKYVVAK
jgi:hypothetical protein